MASLDAVEPPRLGQQDQLPSPPPPTVVRYPTLQPTLPAMVDELYDPETNRLCIKHGDGTNCKPTAAAFTSWKVTVTGDPYGDDGTRDTGDFDVAISSSMTLPQWAHRHTADPLERAEAHRATVRTAHHEAGHRLSGEEVRAAIWRFVSALPRDIPPDDVPAVNAAVKHVAHGFYMAMGRAADRHYDRQTGHGKTQAAEFADEIPEAVLASWRADTV